MFVFTIMNDTYVIILTNIINNISFFVLYVAITIGILGALCNILTFTVKQLRTNAGVFYLLCSTVLDLLTLVFTGILRLMIDYYPDSLPTQSSVFCKLGMYLGVVIPGLATYCVAVASIDRCILTSKPLYLRTMIHTKVARYSIALITCIWLLSSIHIIIFYDIQMLGTNRKLFACLPIGNTYSIFASIYFLVCFLMIPCTLMFISSVLTWLNFIKIQRRIGPVQFQRIANGRIDRHLISIMFIQTAMTLIFLSLRIGSLTNALLTYNSKKDNYTIAIESFIAKLSFIVYILNFSKSFIICILASQLFCHSFYERIITLYKKFFTCIANIFLMVLR